MCQFKSGIILKDRVFIPDYDSHDQMLRELGIDDTRENAGTKFIRAELSPTDDDIFSDIEGWAFKVDQDIRPDWFVKEADKKRMVEAVKEWAKIHILVGKIDFSVSDGTFYLKNCKRVTAHDNSKVTVYGNSTVKARDNSTFAAYENSKVTAYDNSKVEAYNNSKVEAYENSKVKVRNDSTVTAYDDSMVAAYENSKVTAYDNSKVKAYSNSKVEAYNNSTVEAYNNSTVEAYNNSTVIITGFSTSKRENIDLKENSMLKDYNTKTIHQSGDWKFVKVEESNQ
ncbi:hypothetical protein AGMMS49975_29420 [Clostridia bacterium]|nr:hypothetical protein AGMMS49975_29420 [Clostridia bacterium]